MLKYTHPYKQPLTDSHSNTLVYPPPTHTLVHPHPHPCTPTPLHTHPPTRTHFEISTHNLLSPKPSSLSHFCWKGSCQVGFFLAQESCKNNYFKKAAATSLIKCGAKARVWVTLNLVSFFNILAPTLLGQRRSFGPKSQIDQIVVCRILSASLFYKVLLYSKILIWASANKYR